MAKLWNQMIKNFVLKNAPSAGSGGSGSGAINRDPKAIQVKQIGYQLGSGGSDEFEAPLADFELIDTAIQRDSYLTQTVMKYTELIFKSGWFIKGKNEQALEYLKMRLNFMAVATSIPTEELFQGIANDIVRYGNSFIAISRAKGGVGLPQGLTITAIPPSKEPIAGYFRLPPQTITILRDANGKVTKYKQEVKGAGDPIEFKPEDIIHISVNRPAGRSFGDAWLAPVIEDIRLLRKVEENAALLLYRHIFPLLAYTVGIDKPGSEASDEELAELQSVIESMPTDGTILLPERHKIEAIKVDPIDGKPYLEYFEQRVFSGLGMSSVDMGRGDTANRNTADAMSGIKADRVKGWQKSLAMQIDKYMIDQLLVEGGFDPLANIEFDCDFTFEEIEQERKIAKDNHSMQKWNNNVATFEETRTEMGYDTVADEGRLQFSMIGMAVAEHGAQIAAANSVDSQNAPQNQNGKRSAPKSKTESISESVEINILNEQHESLSKSLLASYKALEMDAIESIESHLSKDTFPMSEPKEWLSYLHLTKDKMIQSIEQSTQYALVEGVKKAYQDHERNDYPNVNRESALRVINDHITESINHLESSLKDALSIRLENAKSREESLLAVKGVFASHQYRLNFISSTTLSRSYNYGYALSAIKYGEEFVKPVYEGSCPTCQEKATKLISLKTFSSLDEIGIFYRIPPWHPNCKCPLEYVKGGEK